MCLPSGLRRRRAPSYRGRSWGGRWLNELRAGGRSSGAGCGRRWLIQARSRPGARRGRRSSGRGPGGAGAGRPSAYQTRNAASQPPVATNLPSGLRPPPRRGQGGRRQVRRWPRRCARRPGAGCRRNRRRRSRAPSGLKRRARWARARGQGDLPDGTSSRWSAALPFFVILFAGAVGGDLPQMQARSSPAPAMLCRLALTARLTSRRLPLARARPPARWCGGSTGAGCGRG